MSNWVLGVIGGSGLYDIPGLSGEWRTIESPWGEPSDQIFDAELDGQRVVFLPSTRLKAPAADIERIKTLGSELRQNLATK